LWEKNIDSKGDQNFMELILGAGKLDRIIKEPERFLLKYREDSGYEYINYHSLTPVNKLVPEDLAVTLLLNSRVGYRAFQSLQNYGENIDLNNLPLRPLEQISDIELTSPAQMISAIAQWPGFAASVATKVLHKKRPDLIPILDNQAIFGAYMSPSWPEKRSSQESIKSQSKIEHALQWIRTDVIRPENKNIWPLLKEIEPTHSLIEIFDSIWWMYFRSKEPVAKKPV
jgi:hypothetical protein